MKQKNSSLFKAWHVIYTRSRSEKKVCEELVFVGIECFLPLQKKLRQWKDRKKWIETPLISGYCFVNITRKEYDLVLQTNNVVCYLTFEGKAAIVPNHQIDYLKQMLQTSDFEVSISHENFETGQKVEVIAGPLIGLKGELIDIRGKNRFVLRLHQINAACIVEIQAEDICSQPLEI